MEKKASEAQRQVLEHISMDMHETIERVEEELHGVEVAIMGIRESSMCDDNMEAFLGMVEDNLDRIREKLKSCI